MANEGRNVRSLLRVQALLGCCALAAAIAGCGSDSSAQTTTKSAQGFDPVPPPAEFTTTVDNAWFPLRPGTTLVYKGGEGSTKERDVFKVTRQTKVVNGVRCVVIDDRVYSGGHVAERTHDYYAQDSKGNVWYFGEDTATLDAKGHVKSREGTWHAGVNGARAGLFMPADPLVGETHRQEYYKGHAEDWYKVLDLNSKVNVPYGSYGHALRTREWTPLEPNVVDNKYYARGIGEIFEGTVKGGNERFRLVSVKHS
jgi:hypothetical protein